ncbi:hypothetical protein KM043_000868 [Ampulex compressa]|nr:hypothetical protein KM043_000868 [Ampulex compressa]
MASDLSSGCNETIEVLDEKEEGEISLEDVSSSEEGHLNYGCGIRTPQCPNCLSVQHCAPWCIAPPKLYHSRSQSRRDGVQGKENRHHIRESGCSGTKHVTSTLQEKNDDLVPISSDSDMEIVGLMDNSKQIKIKKPWKRRRTCASSMFTVDDVVSSSSVDITTTACANMMKRDNVCAKTNTMVRSHHRELSPVRKNSRTRIVSRSPSRRHRSSPVRLRSPFKRSRSPIVRARSPAKRRSPKGLKSPTRLPYTSPAKISRKIASVDGSSAVHSRIERHGNVNELLKKVRHLGTVGIHTLEADINRNKEHASSLKEKLLNMMKGIPDDNGDVTNCGRGKSSTCKNTADDADDEEDLALLRQRALETKQKKNTKHNEESKIESTKRSIEIREDDHDDEDLQLRMIALRSAVLKKHHNRIQRGIKSGKSKKSNICRSESPLMQSFLDSIPIPGEELLSFASPPNTPPLFSESIYTEDMELDTDVEREKEKLPYSPTDKIVTNIPIDTELLGIQPSDVSFITLNEANGNSVFSTMAIPNEQKLSQMHIAQNQSFLPNIMYYPGSQSMLYETSNEDALYPPSHIPEVSKQDFLGASSHVPAHPVSSGAYIEMKDTQLNSLHNCMDNKYSQEMPYSPTDTPVYDPDLSHTLPQTSVSLVSLNNSMVLSAPLCNTPARNSPLVVQTGTLEELGGKQQYKQSNCEKVASINTTLSSATNTLARSESPTGSMITSNELPEGDAEMSPPVHTSKDLHSIENIPNSMVKDDKISAPEPLYMQGIPDITKDVNKIPTLINRTLVPASILKSNKQLQQPLLVKKCEVHSEPTFKSADMQPVIVDARSVSKDNTVFKPLKLLPVAKKANTVLTMPIAFHDSLSDDSTNRVPTTDCSLSFEIKNQGATSVQSTNSTNTEGLQNSLSAIGYKRRKQTRKGSKKKCIGTGQLNTAINNDLCSGENNAIITVVHLDKSKPNEKCNKNDITRTDPNESQSNRDENVSNPCDKDIENTRMYLNDSTKKLCSSDVTGNNRDNESDHDGSQNIGTGTLSADKEKYTNILVETHAQNNILQTPCINAEAKSIDLPSNADNNLATSSDITKETKGVDDRRQSLEEDEEALRASLLASLAKRTKPSENNNSALCAMTKVANVQENTGQTVINKASLQRMQKVQTIKTPMNVTNTVGRIITPPHSGLRINSNTSEDEKNLLNAGAKLSDVFDNRDVANINIGVTVPMTAKKRPFSLTKGPLKKMMKKVPIPASTKVVNNAKKYQNTIIQRRLNLLKATNVYNVQKLAESNSLSNVKINESKWSANPKVSSLGDTQRIVISLGSDSESDSESERCKRNTLLSANSVQADKQTVLNPTADLERCVDQFLRDARKKQESAAASKPILPTKKDISPTKQIDSTNSPNLHTPLAVRHLPASRQEEYHRLKQKIIEHEKLKLQRTREHVAVKNNSGAAASKSVLCDVLNRDINHAKQNQNGQPQQITKGLKSNNTSSSMFALQANTTNKSATSVNPKISSDTTLPQSNIESITATNPSMQASILPGPTSENAPLHEATKNTRILPGLKVLTKNELNQKYVQIQVIQDKRVVSINKKINSNGNDVTEKPFEEKNGNTSMVVNNTAHLVQPKVKQNVTSGIYNTEIVDSDASTILLPKDDLCIDRAESFDTTKSTMSLSEYQAENCTQSLSSTENDDHCTLFRTNVSIDNKESIEENWAITRKDIRTELGALINLPTAEQEWHLTDTERKLIVKRYTVLDDLAEMSTSLRRWDMERDLQTNLVAEVRKLREQLRVAEERLQAQRNRINSIGPKVLMAHGKINSGRQECFKLSKICSVLGSKLVGKEYKVPEAAAQLLNSRLKEVANHTRQLSKKVVPSIDVPENSISLNLPKRISSTLHADISESNEHFESEKSDIEDTDVITLRESERTEDATESESNLQENTTAVANCEDVTTLEGRIGTSESLLDDGDTNAAEEKDVAGSAQPQMSSTPIASSRDPDEAEPQGTPDALIIAESQFERQDVEQQTKKILEPYVSILTHLKVPRNANPNGVLCPYELMGTCSDGDCQFIHQSESQTK